MKLTKYLGIVKLIELWIELIELNECIWKKNLVLLNMGAEEVLIFFAFVFFNSDEKLLGYYREISHVSDASGHNWCQISKHQKKLIGEQNS